MEFSRSHTKRNDPVSSIEAAKRVSARVPNNKAIIRKALRDLGPSTSDRIALVTDKYGVDYHEVARRLPDIEADGHVIRCGIAENLKGRDVTQWRIA